MENASKALLIAGGILISVIVVTLLVRTYQNIGGLQRQKYSTEEAERIEEFNKDYTKYDGQTVYGTEVITTINRAANSKSKVTVKIDFQGEYKYKINGIEYTATTLSIDDTGLVYDGKSGTKTKTQITDSATGEKKWIGTDSDLKTRAFECKEIKFDSNTGKVNYIYFSEIQYK